MVKRGWIIMVMSLSVGLPALAQDDDFIFGMVLVGSIDDRGWSQAHYEGGRFVEAHVPGARMIVVPDLNTTASPQMTLRGASANLIEQGAQVIFTTSDTFGGETNEVAALFPGVVFINISGDTVLAGQAPPNVGNVMAQMEWGKLIAGCAAGLTTETGSIGYLGALINSETRRLASSAYLGARYCYETYRGLDPETLVFTVNWIGFWFRIPGDTLDPSEVANDFFDDGADVVISGIDTTEAITVAGERAAQGEAVFAVPYDFVAACDVAPEVCLGVPYFHWGPEYARIAEAVRAGTWEPSWDWVGPDWSDINNPETSVVGYLPGDGMREENRALLDDFIADLAAYATNPFVPPSFALWRGPLRLQDGTFLAPSNQIVERLDVWYLPQLLQGMIGDSN
ncbi:MAG: BMP family ABC transporter substrate-binding protein [Chloroflexi bacterium]|nr:BMP family ABC transporter substrate-binding protein [Chloroflexota bacterium]